MRHAVIMAGGVGTRLWPVSRQSTPKQFQKLIGNESLFQQTFARLRTVLPAEQIWAMTGDQYGEIIAEQIPEFKKSNIITEPAARNTAAASGLATLRILEEDPEAIIIIVPSDHYVGREQVFTRTLEAAFQYVEKNPHLITAIGIHPTSPNTGYGYIKTGEKVATSNRIVVYRVDEYREKPDRTTAEQYLESGQYLWNGGYFIYSAQQMATYFKGLAPEMFQKISGYLHDKKAAEYESIPNNKNLDQVIIEKVSELAVIPAEMEWSDIGDWAALHEVLNAEGKESQIATNNHISNNSVNTLVVGGSKLIATVGLKDVVVIDTDDVILVCNRENVQDVKKIVEQLQEQGRSEYL